MINGTEIIDILIEVICEIFENEKIECNAIIVLEEKDGGVLIQFVLFNRKRKIKDIFFLVLLGDDVKVFANLEEARAYFKNKVQERTVFEKVPKILPK